MTREMTMIDPVVAKFQKEKSDLILSSDRVSRRAEVFTPRLTQLRALPSFDDVETLTIGWTGDSLLVNLKVPDSTLVRELVKVTGIKAVKSPSWDGKSLTATLTFPDKTTIQVLGYKPETCVVVYEEILVPAHVEKRAKVSCGPHEEV